MAKCMWLCARGGSGQPAGLIVERLHVWVQCFKSGVWGGPRVCRPSESRSFHLESLGGKIAALSLLQVLVFKQQNNLLQKNAAHESLGALGLVHATKQ